jgi:tRNA pseudouridine13 synthase
LNAAELLSVPLAHGEPVGRGLLRTKPEDFQVDEWLGFEADGEGDHMLLRVRKRSANTFWVAKELARMAGVHPRDVGYAGMKDRHAVAEQSFTVPLRSRLGEKWNGVTGDGFEVLAANRHRRKLKRGALRGNSFNIVLRDFHGDSTSLEDRLRLIAKEGVPNYFGPQRFGKDGQNLAAALRWFDCGTPPEDRFQRGLAISAARSALFNEVLAHRVREGSWNVLLEGDLANLEGSGSIFSVDAVDETLRQRCAMLDIHPTGPLWNGESSAGGEVRQTEQEIAALHARLSEGLSDVGLEQERRALRAKVSDLQWSREADAVTLRFRLSKGTFATAVLHELIHNAFVEEIPERE